MMVTANCEQCFLLWRVTVKVCLGLIESMCSRMQCAGFSVKQFVKVEKEERLKFVSLLKLGGVMQRRKNHINLV